MDYRRQMMWRISYLTASSSITTRQCSSKFLEHTGQDLIPDSGIKSRTGHSAAWQFQRSRTGASMRHRHRKPKGSLETRGCHLGYRLWLSLPIYLPHRDTPASVHQPPALTTGTGAGLFSISLQNSTSSVLNKHIPICTFHVNCGEYRPISFDGWFY